MVYQTTVTGYLNIYLSHKSVHMFQFTSEKCALEFKKVIYRWPAVPIKFKIF